LSTNGGDIPPSRRDGKRRTCRGAVFIRFCAVGIGEIEKWRICSIGNSQCQDHGSGRMPDEDTLRFWGPIRNGAECRVIIILYTFLD
jgi:hypothetical protein